MSIEEVCSHCYSEGVPPLVLFELIPLPGSPCPPENDTVPDETYRSSH